MNVGATLGRVEIIGIVRDYNGNPKFDDYNNILPQFESYLTDADKEFIKTQTNQVRK